MRIIRRVTGVASLRSNSAAVIWVVCCFVIRLRYRGAALNPFLLYLIAINVVTFSLFAWDKHVAASGNRYRRRVPEARLLGLSLAGGSAGGLIAMYAFRHKTKKWYFVWGLPAFAALDSAVVLYLRSVGLL